MAAVLASSCCLGPLVLLALGFSGAWIGNLAALEPYRPFFVGLALLALGLAGRRLWQPAAACAPGEICALPQVSHAYRIVFVVVAVLVLAAMALPYLAPFFY